MTLSAIAVPLIMFALGAVTSYLAQRYWRKRDLLRRHVESVVTLTAEWYEQLLKLHTADLAGNLSRPQVEEYVRGRLILPKLLYSIGVLDAKGAYPELRAAALEFLTVVTTAKSVDPRHSTGDWFDQRNCVALCIDHFSPKQWEQIRAREDLALPAQRLTGPSLLLPTATEHAFGEVFDLKRDDIVKTHAHDELVAFLRGTPQQSMGQILSRLDEIQQTITRLAALQTD